MKTLFSCIIVAALFGCRPVYCTTTNGVDFLGLSPNGELPNFSWSCETFDRDIRNTVSEFSEYDSKTLNGYGIYIHPSNDWVDEYGRSVAGYTDCGKKLIHIGTIRSVIRHEIVHALQGCYAGGYESIDEGQDFDHANWISNDIYDRLYKLEN